ncbi:MAG: leucyl/phenylalanyl-tRNA--protein transferase [Pirellulaceae bacterium]|nr:leucyl/phenylalanyl-tRNA--protein transferase [Pirellulaceae bacterium]
MPSRIHQLDEPWFPPVSKSRPDGLLMIGGSLSPEWILMAYRRGIFPWPVVLEDAEILAWFSPDPRAVLDFEDLHVPERLGRRIRRGEFEVTFDQAFDAVIEACAAPRRESDGTWITPAMVDAYQRMHELGWAHSVEVWQSGSLVGGLYGMALGGFFAGESMFHSRRDASKAAVVFLVERLRQRGFRLFDVQQSTPHLRRMGAKLIRRREFLARLAQCLELPVTFG